MLDEQDEFLISRMTDGDLSPEERAQVERLLAESAEAREVLRQYRQLNGLMRLARETPVADYDAMRRDILSATQETDVSTSERMTLADGEEVASDTRSRQFWSSGGMLRKLAIAASLVLAVGLSWQFYRSTPHGLSPGNTQSGSSDGSSPMVSTAQNVGVVTVLGPQVERPSTPGVVKIEIGPAPSVAGLPANELYREETRRGASRVAIQPQVLPAREEGRLPF